MARRAAPYVKTGYKVARNLATDYRKYKAAGQSAGTGTTRQHDAKVQYRKKRMPYRKKKKWISHVKKVKAVLAQDDGTKTVLFNAQISSSTSSGATRQNYQFHCLYGCNGSASVSEIGSADLEKIFTNATVSAINTNKLMFKSAVMDMTIANTGTVRCELDLYHLTFHGRTLETSMNACAVDGAGVPLIDPNASGYFTTLDLGTRGCTPFELPAFIRNGKFTIQKKIKYFVEAGDSVTYQIRDAKQHQIAEKNIDVSAPSVSIPRLTQVVLLVHKAVAGADFANNIITTGTSRKYAYTDGSKDDSTGYKNL